MIWIEFLSAAALGFVIVWAWLRRRRSLREKIRRDPVVDDDTVEEILRGGVVRTEEDEPLDLDEIARAEDDFWETESWDPAEEDRF